MAAITAATIGEEYTARYQLFLCFDCLSKTCWYRSKQKCITPVRLTPPQFLGVTTSNIIDGSRPCCWGPHCMLKMLQVSHGLERTESSRRPSRGESCICAEHCSSKQPMSRSMSLLYSCLSKTNSKMFFIAATGRATPPWRSFSRSGVNARTLHGLSKSRQVIFVLFSLSSLHIE